MAVLFAIPVWQAPGWLSVGHADASVGRHVAVRIQSVTTCGVTGAALASAWFSRA